MHFTSSKEQGTNKAAGMRYGDASRNIAGLWRRESLPGAQGEDVVGGWVSQRKRHRALATVFECRRIDATRVEDVARLKQLMQADTRS